MFRYLSILLLAGAAFSGVWSAWSQDITDVTDVTDVTPPKVKVNEPQDEKVLKGEKSLEEPKADALDASIWGKTKKEKKLALKKLPKFELKGLVKLEDSEFMALLQIEDKGLFRVKAGDEITLTIPYKDVMRPYEPPPIQPGTTQAAGSRDKPAAAKNQGGKVGIQTTISPQISPDELQIVFKVIAITRQRVEIEILPRKERIMVR